MTSGEGYPERIRLAGRQSFCAARDLPGEVVTACGVSLTGRGVAEWLVEAAVDVTCRDCCSVQGVA